MGWKGWNRLGSVMAILVMAAVLVVIPATHTLHPSGDLSYGDAVVGVGTLALALFTGALARATYQVDDRAAQREFDRRAAESQRDQERQDHETRLAEQAVMGIARLVVGELEYIRESLGGALAVKGSPMTVDLPRQAWESGAVTLIASLPEEDALVLINIYTSSLVLTRTLDELRVELDGKHLQTAYAGGVRKEIQRLLHAVEKALTLLRPVALSSVRPDLR